jgi:hypothetical protein
VRTINTAEITYATAYQDLGFTCNLEKLAGPTDDCSQASSASADHACLIDNVLGSGRKSGYAFSIENCSGDGGPMTHFEVIARPVSQGQSGQRTFCSDQTGVIKTTKAEQTLEGCLENGIPLQ